ncbi:MAG TPA: gliding motility-associated C-terminal domain-containing protein [Bacteroidia bacterium]|jgi:gliding motility-associated-like protein|nr:gliding motility-associated C-terminal domain-containing protein [Bacteroidia bacterium]
MRTKLLVTLSSLLLFCFFASAQNQLTPKQWEKKKKHGKLDGKAVYSLRPAGDTVTFHVKMSANDPHPHPASTSCACWQQRDTSFHVCQFDGSGANGGPGVFPDYRNDDWTTNPINLPFTFCLYGTNWTQVYINNNGNVSFGSPYSTFTATGFPNNSFVMVAPFWGDVDTRGGLPGGIVYYKLTPTHLIVQWDSVGYYDSYTDKLNTFQLIMTNGSDPLVPGGNVSFCYKDMQWTTGDASGGVGGFGGSDAVVGANEGDGINYIEFGQFSAPGGTYNGPGSPGSGIDWLDNQSFIFNSCTNSNNVPPTANGLTVCDTLYVCVGDSLPLNVTFFSPEVGQTTVITTSATGTGYNVVSNTSGNTAALTSYFIGSMANLGYNVVTITATDNGSPAGVTIIPVVIDVVTPPITTISNDTTVCGGPVPLVATGGGTYLWTPATGIACDTCGNTTANPPSTTTYICAIDNGCTVYDTVTVTIQTANAIAGPDTSFCVGGSVQLHAIGGVSYSWSPVTGLSNPLIANPVATPTVTTTYTVTVTDAVGCTGTDMVTVTISPSPTATFIALPTSAFIDSTFTFTDQSTGAVTWTWNFGDGNTSTQQNPTHFYTEAGTYHVCLIATSASGCADSICSDVTVIPHGIIPPNVFTPNDDNTNDVLVFKNLEYYPNSMIQIYDRWGVLVYENGNYLNDWNGNRNGGSSQCTDGTYYYILSGPNIPTPLTGFVMLIRGK